MSEKKVHPLKIKTDLSSSLSSDSPILTNNPVNIINEYTTKNLNALKSGDIIMCHSSSQDSITDKIIEDATYSPWEHCGIVLKDPYWINSDLKGLYILQSGWGPNGYPDILNNNVSGVTLNRLYDFLCNRIKIYVISISKTSWNESEKQKFSKAFANVHGKQYDKNICHWFIVGISSILKCECCSRKVIKREDKQLWCSALVAYMYTQMAWLNKTDDWTCETPADIIKWKLQDNYLLSEPWLLKK